MPVNPYLAPGGDRKQTITSTLLISRGPEELSIMPRSHSQRKEQRHLAPRTSSTLLVGAKSCGLGFSLSQAFQKPAAYREREVQETRLKLNMLNGAQMYETGKERA